MPTYSKETALYDTGKIATDITGAGETASKYITAIDNNGIKVHAESNPTTNYTKIDANGMEVYQNVNDTATKVASFGKDGAQIGQDGSYNMSMMENGINGVNENNVEYFGINYDPTVEDEQTITSSIPKLSFDTIPNGVTTRVIKRELVGVESGIVVTIPASEIMVTFYGSQYTGYTASSLSGLRYEQVQSASGKVKCYLKTNGSKTFTVGTSKTLSYSGRITTNVSTTFHSEITVAYNGSTNEITYTYTINASSEFSNVQYRLGGGAIRYYAIYHPTSIHVGNVVSDMGRYSAAFGIGLDASASNQTVVGKYNSASSNGIFVVGDGTEDSTHNALVVSSSSISLNHSTSVSGNMFVNGGNMSVSGDVSVSYDLTASNIGAKNWVAPSSVSCRSGKWYKVAEVTLDPGIWFIDCNALFPSTSATGTRQIRVTTETFTDGTTTAPASYGNITNDVIMGANIAQYPQSHFPVDISSQTTFRLAAYQGSGSTMSVTGRMYATRIK